MYPYFIIPDIQLLNFPLVGAPEREKAIRRIAANIGDPLVVRRILNIDPEEFARFYPDMTPATPSTVDTIDTFISTYSKPKQTPKIKKSLDELIRNGEYEEAIERIKEQNLNNPEKSIYFADQLRFLRKLLLLKRIKQN